MNLMNRHRFGVFSYIGIDNSLYYFERSGVGICKYDKKTKKTSVVFEDSNHSFFSYSSVTCVDGNLVFSPYLAKSILLFHLKDNKVETYPIGEEGLSVGVFKNGNSLYFIRQSDNIIKFDMDTKEACIIPIINEISVSTHSDFSVVQGSLFVPVNSKGLVMELKLDTKQSVIHNLETDDVFNTIAYANNCFWLTSDDECITAWNMNDNSIKRIDISSSIEKRENLSWNGLFSSSILMGNELFFAPLSADSLLKYNVCSGVYDSIFKIPSTNVCWCIEKWGNNELYFSLESEKYLPEMDFVIDLNGNIKGRNIMGVEDDSNLIILETNWDSLELLIEDL